MARLPESVPERSVEAARAAFDRQAWQAAADGYAAAEEAGPLAPVDLGHAGLAAHLVGDEERATDLLTRAHGAALEGGDPTFAALMAYWLAMMLADRGEMAVAGGWLARARHLVEEHDLDTVVNGYLRVPQALRLLDEGDPAGAFAVFEEVSACAERFAEVDLATMARLGRGQALLSMGEIERGVAFLDDAMLAVTAGGVGPVVTGIVYCAAIEAFHRIYDLRRAQGWTEALTRWRESQPDLVPYRGRCLVYRAELMRLRGDWPSARKEVRLAEEWLLRPPPEPSVGEAFYLQGDLLRLEGDLDAADIAYRQGAHWGRRPEPGIALLRLAQGRRPAAASMLRRAIDETPEGLDRAPLLDALVTVALAGHELDAARTAAEELGRLATVARTPLLDAIAAAADGWVRLAADEPAAALARFRRAAELWRSLDVPYESARAQEGIGLACRALGDADGSAIALDAAREAFRRLGAVPDAGRLDRAIGGAPSPGGLSAREVEVLGRLARGATNREIAEVLGISERTVDRHVSNIYTKLDVSTRAAATAFAMEHGLA